MSPTAGVIIMRNAIQDYVRRGYSLVPLKAIAPAPGEKKWKKKPIIKWEDRKNKAPDEMEVMSEFKKFPNALIGCVTGRVSGICTLDIDDDEGRILANKLIPDSLLVPTFTTMSGGLQMIFQNPDPSIPGKVRFLPGLDYRGEGSLTILPPSHNANGGKYSWLDGLSLNEVEPPSMPSALSRALSNINVLSLYRGGVDTSVDSTELFTDGRRDNDLFHTANCLAKGGMPAPEILQVLNKIVISWGESPDPKWIEAKVQSAMSRSERRERTLSTDVREWVLSTSGVFLSTDIYHCLQLSTREDKKNVSIILKRLSIEGVIEKYGNKNGQYRCLNNECEDINFLNASTESVDIRWPFGIEGYVKTLPKNIIVIAGEPNAGKTAFLLNVIRMNQAKHPINYYSSEMGAIELRDRLSKFETPLESWSFVAKERASNFADVIKPDEINIIDFLEVHDEFYKIGGLIKEIYDKLSKGIAIIAIQKNRGNEYGLGGTRGLEKARLYLSMEPNHLKIIKGKNWTGVKNPNGLGIDFKLVQGCKFVKESEWKAS